MSSECQMKFSLGQIMRFFDQKLSLAILFLTLPLLFLPKINLFMVDSGETAGLRIDDLVLFFLGCLLMWSHARSHQRLYPIEGWILLLTALSFFSFLLNRLFVSLDLLHVDAKIFYVIRLLEYFLFFYLGMVACRHLKGAVIIRAFLLFNLFLMLLQRLNITGGMISAGYQADVSERVQGIASFPSEMGLLLNLLFCFLIYDRTPSKCVNLLRSPYLRHLMHRLYPYWMFCLFGVFVILTGNRISILALTVCFLFRLKQDFSASSMISWLLLSLLIPLVVLGSFYMISQTAGVYERSSALFSLKNINLIEVVWDKIDITQQPLGNDLATEGKYDLSWWIRIHKWLFALKSYLLNPECYLQGLGPGFCGAALDGGILRIIIEYGLIGVYLFGKFFASLYRINLQTKWMIIAFGINMIFFDAYLAYKTMSLLLFSCGYLFVQQQRANSPIINNRIPINETPIGCQGI